MFFSQVAKYIFSINGGVVIQLLMYFSMMCFNALSICIFEIFNFDIINIWFINILDIQNIPKINKIHQI